MNATQKMIAAVAIVAVLAVAAVGAGFAYTASTSNTNNNADMVYFTLEQGQNVTDYSASFDVDITYDTVTSVEMNTPVTDVDDATDEDINAIPAVATEKEAYEAAAAAYIVAYNAVFTPAVEDVDDMAEANLVKIDGFVTAKTAYEAGQTEETTAAYLAAYNAIFDEVADVGSMVEANVTAAVLVDTTGDAYLAQVAIYENYTKAYVLSGDGKQFTVDSSEATTPQYYFKVSAESANMNVVDYGFIIGVAFKENAEISEMEFASFDGSEKVFDSDVAGKDNITFGLYLFEKPTQVPTAVPFANLEFDFVVDSEEA